MGFENEQGAIVDDSVESENFNAGEGVASGFENDESTDPWDWAVGLEPEKIQKTWTNYTKNAQELAKERDELKPIAELRDEIMSNPQLQAHLKKFYEGQVDSGELELSSLRSELDGLKTELTVEKELVGLESYVKSEGLPEYDKRELLEFAAKGNYPSLEDAYKSFKFDEIRQSVEDKTYDKVKQTRGAAIPKVGAADKRTNKSFTESDLSTMSDEDFIKNYAQISKQMSRGM
jgi:hypothetical protein